MNNRQYDEDLEIPQIDGMDRKGNRTNTEIDDDGIPLFLKGQETGNRKPVDKEKDIPEFLRGDNQSTRVIDEEELPDFLTGGDSTETDTATKVAPAVLSEMEEDPQPLPSFEAEEKKSSMAGTIILSILIFIVLTAVLLFVGIKVVDHYAPKPSIAPLEPVTTVTPEASPTASPIVEGEGA